MRQRSPEELADRIYESKSKSRMLIALITLVAAGAAGAAALSTNIVSIRDNVTKLLWPPAQGPVDLKLRDVRITTTYAPEGKSYIHVAVKPWLRA